MFFLPNWNKEAFNRLKFAAFSFYVENVTHEVEPKNQITIARIVTISDRILWVYIRFKSRLGTVHYDRIKVVRTTANFYSGTVLEDWVK